MINKKVTIFFAILLALVSFSIAAHIINPQSYSVNQSISVLYNISINNTDVGQIANITQLNITLPNNNFTFVSGTNGTNSIGSFANESLVLFWTNSTSYLVNGSETKYFWFNSSASYPGNYNITITVLNGTNNYSYNISVSVNDTSSPTFSFISPVNNGNISGNNYILNVSVVDYSNVSSVSFNVTNSTGNVTALKIATNNSVNQWNSSLNTVLLADGTYNITSIANDSLGYFNNTTITILVDNTPPTVPQLISTNITTGSIKFNITVSDTGSKVYYCSYTINGGSASNATFVNNTLWRVTDSTSCEEENNYTVTCFDYAGNSRSNNTNFTSSDCTTSSSSNAGTAATTTWTWSTAAYNDQEFSYKLSINKNMSEKDRISIKFNGETHYIGVIDIKESSVVVNVSSNPQQATINIGSDAKFNIDGDNYYDIKVRVNSLNSTKANLTMSYVHEIINSNTGSSSGNNQNLTSTSNNSTGNDTNNENKKGTGWIIIVLIIIIIIIIGVLIVWFATNKGGNPFKKDKYLQL